jgi:hypothetical protein
VGIFARATLEDLAAYRAGTLACGLDGRLCRLDRCDTLGIACDAEGWPTSDGGHWPSAGTRDVAAAIAEALGCGCGGACGCGGT